MSGYILILEEDVVISQDISEISAEVSPGVEVRAVRDLDGAVQTVSEFGPPKVAIVNWPYADLIDCDLERQVSGAGARIVVTRGVGQNSELAPSHWIVLPHPFTTEMLRTALT